MPRDRRDLVYLIGEPGIGKTTTMRALTSGLSRVPLDGQPGRELLAGRRNGEPVPVAVELGRSRGMFSGTDALGMAVVVDAERYLRTGQAAAESTLLLAEGARLANARFLSAAVESGWRTLLVYLSGPAIADERRQLRGSDQNESWVRGAATRAARLASDPPAGVHVLELPAGPPPRVLAETVLTAVGRRGSTAAPLHEVTHG